jgi:type I restriction enzyme, S subunit
MSWKTVKLEKICKMNSGGTPSRGIKEYYSGDIPWAKISDIEAADGGIVYSTEEHITKDGLNAINNRIFKKGTLLLAMYGSVGKVAFTGVDMSTNQAILGIRIIDETVLDYSYLKYWFQTIKSKLLDRAVGGTLQNISLGIVKDLEIPLPPLATQKRIAEILDAADALRRKDQELLKKYDELAQAIFIDMFGDPVKNEKGWETKALKSVTTKIGSGATPTGGKTAYKSEGISLIRSMNVYDFSFKWKDLAFIDETQAARLDNVTVQSRDVLFNITGASVCRCSIVPDELLPARVNQHVAIIRAKTDFLNPIFLNHLLVSNSVKTKLLGVGAGGGAVMEAITKDQLEQFEIIVPPLKLQDRFEQLIDNLFAQKRTEINSNEDSERLFNSLIQKAFKGELVA